MTLKLKSVIFAIIASAFCLLGCESKEYVSDIKLEQEPTAVCVPLVEPDISTVTKNVSFIACGDNIIYRGNINDAREKAVDGGREYNFKPMYEKVASIIEEADIAFINQETVMAGEGYSISDYPTFNSPQDLGYDLDELGFDVINIANNHMLDKGAGGLQKTIEFWKGMDVLMIGGYEDAEDFDDIRIYVENGITIAFLSYTYGTNGITKPASSPIVIPYINDEDIKRQVEAAKKIADIVIVSVHWGQEGDFTPNAEEKRLAQLMADYGVDVILGHHPHVIQPVEWLTGKDGNKTLCVYSLGNFMAEQAYDYNMVGGILSFDIIKQGNNKPFIENVLFTPTVFHFPSTFRDNTIYLMADYTPELANAHGVRRSYGHAISYDRLIKYATDAISSEFLPDSLKITE